MDFNASNINSTTGTAAVSASRQVTAHKVLTEGSSVPVRITRSIGEGRYEGFVAGVKVSISSERALKPGDVFTATVSGSGTKIILTPQTEGITEVSSQTLSAMLQGAGLSSDVLSTSIFQLFTQTGLKLDTQLMNRIRSIAVRFGEKQKSAAEILVMLAEKGIAADEEEIKQLLLQLTGELSWQEGDAEKNDNQKNHEKLINRLNGKNGAWYLLPFELVQYEGGVTAGGEMKEMKSVLGGGNLRLLFDSGKMLKLMNLDCIYRNKRYVFSLGYEGGKCKSVRFNTGEDGNTGAAGQAENQIIEKLKKLFLAADMTGLDISWKPLADIEGNAGGLENIYTFGGVV